MSNTTNMMSVCCHATPIVYIDHTRKQFDPLCTVCENECDLIDADDAQVRGTAIPNDYIEGIQYFRNRFLKTK